MLSNESNFGLGVWIIYMLWIGASLAQTSLIISIWLAFSSLGQTPAGIFADRYGYKTSLVFGGMILLTGATIFAFAQSFIWLLIGFSLAGFGTAMKEGADQALLYESLKQQKEESTFKKILGKLQLNTNIFIVVTSIIGGFLYAIHPRIPLFAEVVVAAISLLACIILIEPKRKMCHFPILAQIKSSLHTAFYTPHFSKIFIFSALIGSIAQMTLPYAQPVFQILEIPKVYFGWISAAFFLSRGLGSWYSEQLGKIFTIDKYLVLHASVFALFLIVMQHVTSVFYVLPVLGILFFLRGLYAPTVSTYVNEKVGSDKRATMLSVNQQLLTAISAIGLTGMGVIAEMFGLWRAFSIISILSLMFLVAYVVSLRKVQMD